MVASQQNSTEQEPLESKKEEAPSRAPEVPVQDLADRLREVDGVSDDVAEKLAQNWQRYLGAIVVVVLIVWAVNGYQKGRQKMLDEAAFGFVQAQNAFSALSSTDTRRADDSGEEAPGEDTQDGSERAFKDTMGLLASNSGSGVYSQLARVYQAAATAKGGKYDEALSQLQSFPVGQYSSVAKTLPAQRISQEQFVNEVAALMGLKIQLLQNPDNVQKVWPALVSLARGSQLVCIEAMITAFRVSDGPEQRGVVISLAQELAETRPAYRDLIQGELRQFGVNLEKPEQESA